MLNALLDVAVVGSKIYFIQNGRDENRALTPTGQAAFGPAIDADDSLIGAAILENLHPLRTLTPAENEDIEAAERAYKYLGFKNYDDFHKSARLVFVKDVDGAFSFVPTKRQGNRIMSYDFEPEVPVGSKDVEALGRLFREALSRCR